MRYDVRMQYLQKLEDRDQSQDKNLRNLITYAKKITADLEDYKQKVETSEKIVADLKQSGNESVDSLLGMLKKYKRAMRNTQEEIEKLNQLILVKDNEITTLNQELSALTDFRSNMESTNQQKIQTANKMIEENKAVMKRQDKLITDLNQKNEISMITIAQTEQMNQKRQAERTALSLRLKELTDQRAQMTGNIETMTDKLHQYKDYLVEQDKIDQERKAQKAREDAERAAMEA